MSFQRKNIHQSGWQINFERLRQKLILLRRMDPQQHKIIHLWQPPKSLKMAVTFLGNSTAIKKCSIESLNNSKVYSEEKLSSTGLREKACTKWSLLKPNLTWLTWSHNYKNIKMPLPRKKTKLMKNNLKHDFIS